MKIAPSNDLVIFDGECRLCRASVAWLQLQLKISAQPFQSADLAPLGLTRQECAKEVIVVIQGLTYRGAAAVAYLLRARGDSASSILLRATGPLGSYGYRWVATHRNSLPVKGLTRILERQVLKATVPGGRNSEF